MFIICRISRLLVSAKSIHKNSKSYISSCSSWDSSCPLIADPSFFHARSHSISIYVKKSPRYLMSSIRLTIFDRFVGTTRLNRKNTHSNVSQHQLLTQMIASPKQLAMFSSSKISIPCQTRLCRSTVYVLKSFEKSIFGNISHTKRAFA